MFKGEQKNVFHSDPNLGTWDSTHGYYNKFISVGDTVFLKNGGNNGGMYHSGDSDRVKATGAQNYADNGQKWIISMDPAAVSPRVW
jgi:hypothetical protein